MNRATASSDERRTVRDDEQAEQTPQLRRQRHVHPIVVDPDRAQHPDLHAALAFHVTVGVGDPAKMLCEEAGRLGAQAIVVGNRRVQGMSRVLGSVAGDVTKMAPCDVMVANTCDHG